ncbi:hypothetical protein [Coralloluteibacterium thermophilus]|uniref:Uncharacterized protein n=1 Tax=Coralloluteibacterium thermophilum TaxID=2707049 RepID=A0ABV9NQJ5_9GAMM
MSINDCDEGDAVVVTCRDGSRRIGVISSLDEESLILEDVHGDALRLAREAVAAVVKQG